MRIGLFHPNARSIHAMSPAMLARCADPLDIEAQVAVARAAEEIRLDYLFMADAWGRYGPHSTAMGLQDPILLPPILAAALIPVTTRIGHLVGRERRARRRTLSRNAALRRIS